MEIINQFKEYEIKFVDFDRLQSYVHLLEECFPAFNVSKDYLNWLYFENPLGQVIGFDAICEGQVIAHYACVPIRIAGIKGFSLLSVNTATSPKFQGRGIFKVLALNTYQRGTELGFSCVIGVANQNSFRSFTRHLGFEHLGNLELRFGFVTRKFLGSRIYSTQELAWRAHSPLNKFELKMARRNFAILKVRLFRVLRLTSIVFTDLNETLGTTSLLPRLTLDWRRDKKPLLFLPTRFKPSPLALIFLSLDGVSSQKLTSFSFPDFDAY